MVNKCFHGMTVSPFCAIETIHYERRSSLERAGHVMLPWVRICLASTVTCDCGLDARADAGDNYRGRNHSDDLGVVKP